MVDKPGASFFCTVETIMQNAKEKCDAGDPAAALAFAFIVIEMQTEILKMLVANNGQSIHKYSGQDIRADK